VCGLNKEQGGQANVLANKNKEEKQGGQANALANKDKEEQQGGRADALGKTEGKNWLSYYVT
jgi:hypothetical protein